MRPPKTDFRFLFYTPKNMYIFKEKVPFFNSYKVKKKSLIQYSLMLNSKMQSGFGLSHIFFEL